MSQYTDEPRFTIEQIDLLQRLRRSGMTKPEIVHALDTLERLDREHGDKFGRRGSASSSCGPAPSVSDPAPSHAANESSTSHMAVSTATTATQTQFLSPSPSNSYATSPPVSLVAVTQNGTANGKLSPPRFPAGNAAAAVAVRPYGFDGTEEEMDVDDKVEDLMRSVIRITVACPISLSN